MLEDKELAKILKLSLGDFSETKTSKLNETYVAQVKKFRTVSELASEKTRVIHEKIYVNLVQRLNEVSARLDGVDKSKSNSECSDWRSLKKDESKLLNAVWLHELFFANSYDVNSEIFMDTLSYTHLSRDWGTFEAWQNDFYACAQAAKEGWVVCGYNMFLRRFVNVVVDGDDNGMQVGLVPLVVLDMQTHAYLQDFGLEKSKYVVSMMQQFNWEVIEERIHRINDINEALR